jgi:hypothetical protein
MKIISRVCLVTAHALVASDLQKNNAPHALQIAIFSMALVAPSVLKAFITKLTHVKEKVRISYRYEPHYYEMFRLLQGVQ